MGPESSGHFLLPPLSATRICSEAGPYSLADLKGRTLRGNWAGTPLPRLWMSTGAALYDFRIFCYATGATNMDQKPRKKVFTLNTLIDGHIIRGHVAFSPAPEPGIMTDRKSTRLNSSH